MSAPDTHRVTSGRSDRQLFGWLWQKYLRPWAWWVGLAVLLMAIEGSTMGLLSYMLKPMFDDVFLGANHDAIWTVGFIIFALFVVRGVTSVAQKVVMTTIAQRTIGALQKDLLAHLMLLDSDFHQRHAPGHLISRVQNDVLSVGTLWNMIVSGAGRDLVGVISLFSVALWIDWRWTLIALIGTPLLVAPTLLVQRMVRKNARLVQELSASMSTRIDEVFHGIGPVKLNLLEAYQSRRFGRLVDRRIKAEINTVFWKAMIPGIIDVATGIGFLGVMIYGAREIIDGDKTVGEFMSFFTALGLAFEPLRRLGQLSGFWQAAAAGIERIVSLFDTRPTLQSPARPAAVDHRIAQKGIELRDVTLAYGELPVLNGISFSAEPGRTTALVGASGAGKSTIFNLLTRMLDPATGQVLIGGTDTRDMDLAELRALFSVVSQEALLFDESLRENILLGQEGISQATLDIALDTAHAREFISRMPQGLDTLAGPRGSGLSGGQRQRIAIARAVLRDRPILLLDEPTSALDAQSEVYVQDALEALSKNRTTLVIAHRLSTVRKADKIVVLEKGRVVDEGDHDTLMARGGTYADLHRLQIEGG